MSSSKANKQRARAAQIDREIGRLLAQPPGGVRDRIIARLEAEYAGLRFTAITAATQPAQAPVEEE